MIQALFADGAAWFSVPAIAGTAVFLLKVLFMLIGGDTGAMDLGVDGADVDITGDPTAGFKALSLQSVSAFIMGFGWGGVAGMIGMGWSWPVAAAVGIGCGVAMMWVLALGLKGMHDLQSSGNVAIDSTIGRQGSVYITVPADGVGRGQVRIVLGNKARMFQAIAAEGEGAISTGTAVRVMKVNGDNTLTVARA